jgi:hypothetical protein
MQIFLNALRLIAVGHLNSIKIFNGMRCRQCTLLGRWIEFLLDFRIIGTQSVVYSLDKVRPGERVPNQII